MTTTRARQIVLTARPKGKPELSDFRLGIAGGLEKCGFVKDELRFDAAVDHRAADFPARLAAACPDGIDVYFENVGGATWQAVLPLLNVGKLIVRVAA